MTQTDGKIYSALELEESILWKWLYYLKQSTDFMWLLWNCQGQFSWNWNKIFYNFYENTKDHEEPQQSWWGVGWGNRGWGIILPDFRLYYKAAVIKKCGTGTKTGI